MDEETFKNLKVGDRVICEYGSGATVVKVGIIDVHNKEPMVKLKPDRKRCACDYFFRSELLRME